MIFFYTSVLIAIIQVKCLDSTNNISHQVFPSASTLWSLPGYFQTPTDPSTLAIANSSKAVELWEISHVDLVFGGDYGPINNKKIVVTSYMYNQMLNYDPTALEMALKIRSLNTSGTNIVFYEDFFLHFTEDTEFVVPFGNVILGSWTSLRGVPWIFGYTNGPDHAGFSVYSETPWDIYPWQYSNGAVYVVSFEKFDSLVMTIGNSSAKAGHMLVEYAGQYDVPDRRQATSSNNNCWKRLVLLEDSTANLTRSGVIRWIPPTDWKIATLNDGSGRSYGGGFFGGNSLMSTGGLGYAVRVRWSGTGSSLGPRLDELLQRQWIVFSQSDGTRQVVPGWDSRNDRDHNGFVDDTEYRQLVNTKATARMRQESRAFTLGQMWSQRSSGCRVNAWNPTIAVYLADYLNQTWASSGLRGAYNDDLLKMLGPEVFPLSRGGMLAEYHGLVNSTNTSLAYQMQFTNILKTIIKTTKSKYISGNISGVNLFASAALSMFILVLNLFLRESYLSAGLGLTGYFGMQKTWDTFAYAALRKKTLIQGQVSFGMGYGAITLVNRHAQSSWERDIASILAMFYLINIPGSTSFQSWGNGYYYGSSNTFDYNYYKAGVPMNIAYQPTDMLKVDIGEPKKSVSELLLNPTREFMTFQTSTVQPPNGYTVIGNSTSTKLHNAEISPDGYLEVIPSLIYYLQRAPDHPQIPTTPVNCILAREYTKGLVLYRTDVYGGSLNFLKSNVTVTLPGGSSVAYRRVFYNGSIGPVITTITLGGYESAILIDAKSIPTPISPTISPSIVSSVIPTKSPSLSTTTLPSAAVNPEIFKLAWYYNFSTELSWDFNVYQGPFSSSSTTYFVKTNALVKNNQLSLRINNNSVISNGKKYLYSSAGIGSWKQHSQIYGRWEVEAKFPSGYGVTGYIGLFPTNKNWPPEVDFGEVIGRQPGSLYLTQHYGANYTVHKQVGSVYVKSGVDWTNSFHVFALEWTPSTLAYFVDNVMVHNQSVSFLPTPMDLAIGVGAGDCTSWSWVKCPDDAISQSMSYPLPATMVVNHIKRYLYRSSISFTPTSSFTNSPTVTPTVNQQSSQQPTVISSQAQSPSPSDSTSVFTSLDPTAIPSSLSTRPQSQPTSDHSPTTNPSNNPTIKPSFSPSTNPSNNPTIKPSFSPSTNPSNKSNNKPSFSPSIRSSNNPTIKPSFSPSIRSSNNPTIKPSLSPSIRSSNKSTNKPSLSPSTRPSNNTTNKLTFSPSIRSSNNPTIKQSFSPSIRSSSNPTIKPSFSSSIRSSHKSTIKPSFYPSIRPSHKPTNTLSKVHSGLPTLRSTSKPSSTKPTVIQTYSSTKLPSCKPSQQSKSPSQRPTRKGT